MNEKYFSSKTKLSKLWSPQYAKFSGQFALRRFLKIKRCIISKKKKIKKTNKASGKPV